MWLKSTAFCLALTFLALGSIGSPPAMAQSPSAFSFTLQESSLVGCWYYGVSFDGTQGQQFTAQWSQSPSAVGPVSVNFYISPLEAVQQIWLCDKGPVNIYWDDGAYGTANWAPPSTGGYAVLVVNYGPYPVSGTISITSGNATLSATPIGPAFARRIVPSCGGFRCAASQSIKSANA